MMKQSWLEIVPAHAPLFLWVNRTTCLQTLDEHPNQKPYPSANRELGQREGKRLSEGTHAPLYESVRKREEGDHLIARGISKVPL